MDSGLGVRPVKTLAIACILYALSIILINIAPFFVGLYVDTLHISLSEAGFVQTIDQAGGIIGAVLGFFLMPRLSWRTLSFALRSWQRWPMRQRRWPTVTYFCA